MAKELRIARLLRDYAGSNKITITNLGKDMDLSRESVAALVYGNRVSHWDAVIIAKIFLWLVQPVEVSDTFVPLSQAVLAPPVEPVGGKK